jgi:DNA mismatch repair ATPase MutS
MIKFIVAVAGAAGVLLYWWYNRYQKRWNTRQKLARSWAKSKDRDRNWAQIRQYHDLIAPQSSRPVIDDDTWDDLNLDELFELIDRTESDIGQQLLFDMLRRPARDTDLLQRRAQRMQLMANNEQLRLDFQMELRTLTGFRISRLPTLIFGQLPQLPRWYYGFLAMPVLALASVVLGFVNPVFFLGLAVLPVVNLIIQSVVGGRLARFTAAISGMRPFLSAAEAMGSKEAEHGNPLGDFGDAMRSHSQELRTLKSRVSKYLHQGGPDNMGTLIWDYLNILLLLKINMFTLSVREIQKHQQTLQKLYHQLGHLDAIIAAASFKEGLGQQCRPQFKRSGNELCYKQMYHPLLEDPVPNSITVGERGILVTGSNMSGKTTFLKTVGVNQILAQTFNFCCAEGAQLCFCKVTSSMRRNDDLTEGKSFYMGEVERVKKLIDAAGQTDINNLFLLDEIFRGTNTIERISASLEVLKWLNKEQNFVLASTHDLELVDLLEREYEFYHFAEEVSKESLTFDYKLKPGHSSTKNAIKLLGVCNYPDEIVNGAMKLSRILEQEGVINYGTGSDTNT